jgi:uncharacterized protein
MQNIEQVISKELGVKTEYVQNVVKLLDDGNTIPFIARYRKEAHGAMDDTALRSLEERLKYLRGLNKRIEEVAASIEGQGKLTDEIISALEKAATLAEVEDIYRPYKQKRKTRASVAREKGLEGLAAAIIAQEKDAPPIERLAEGYISEEKGVANVEEALAGASDIIAEDISDNAEARKQFRENVFRYGSLKSSGDESVESVYTLYYDFSSPLPKLAHHQILAINRGENEGFLKVSIEAPEAEVLPPLVRRFVVPGRPYSAFVRAAAEDAYSRLIFPSVERELRSMLTEEASEGAIHNFALNLKPLLMQPPLRGRVTLGYDPGYRNGCKLAVVDETGKLLDTAVIYPTQPYNKTEEAKATLSRLIKKHKISCIAIGNGTASRESELLVSELAADFPELSYAMVNESGASVYSASKLAAEEFPELDVNLRSAVSIARRLQDPLAELVKIDPKAIGVGQYQHDMPQARLSEALGGVIESCVNSVGADLNTASPSLLEYIAGLNKTTAKNIVAYREKNGAFRRRSELLKVPRLGPAAYEQCAGFLRIAGGDNILDNSSVHPESYKAAEKLLNICGFTLEDVSGKKLEGFAEKLSAYGREKAAAECSIGLPTLDDIVKELNAPGRDPRDELPKPELRRDVLDIKDLKPGMVLTGTVRNVIDFGAFVDIGVHQDGLVHISQIADRFIRHPSEVLSVGETVKVMVLEADEKKKRISLSIKQVK